MNESRAMVCAQNPVSHISKAVQKGAEESERLFTAVALSLQSIGSQEPARFTGRVMR
jgi:hypothetical protein